MYYVIYSANPYLLARLCTELQMEGVEVDMLWCEYFHPFSKDNAIKWMMFEKGIPITFHPHNGIGKPIRFHLLENNYTWVLQSIIEFKKL